MGPRLGVLGWPVRHSRSPAIQNAALAAVGLAEWRYQLLPVPPILFSETVRALPGAGFRGANVTIPHKEAALALADDATASARAIGAANTLTFDRDGAIHADNTDAPGLIATLPFDAAGRSALVLGAGGSARAAVWALLEAGTREVRVWNRSPERARALCAELGGIPVLDAEPADLLVNCTSVGLDGDSVERSATDGHELNQLGLTFDQLGEYSHVIDLVYRSKTTELLDAARAHGARTVDGLEILVQQGALSLQLWTGHEPSRDIMRQAAGRDPAAD